MNASRYRAWRFVHPDFDSSEGVTGLRVTPAGRVSMVEDDASVRQSLLLLLSTNRGERVMRPEYGSDLRQLAFASNDETTAGLAIHYVRRAVERWEPRVEIVNIDAGPHPEHPERLNVTLRYQVRATGRSDELVVTTNLAEGI